MIWLALTFMLALAAAFAAAPFLRSAVPAAVSGERTGVYRRQIAEIDDEEKRALIGADEAEALRREAQRRLLSASESAAQKEISMPLSRTTTALAIAGLVIAGGVSLYAITGQPLVTGENVEQRSLSPSGSPESFEDVVAQVKARLAEQPDDAEGWRVLGWSYFNLSQYDDAVAAYARATALAPDNVDYLSSYAEAMVMAASGEVNDEVRDVLKRALAIDPTDPRAQFFNAMALDQAGDTEGAIDAWIMMVNTAPPGAPWVNDVRRRVEARAQEAGIDISGRLQEQPALAGPTAAQVDAAAQMSPEQRAAMIESMVGRLASRLAENPRDADGWIQLIRSQMVLGQQGAAEVSLQSALAVFSDDPAQAAHISAAAAQAGVVLPSSNGAGE
ncbi:MAG: c-type cytochrome biogenesis protein CcmI [Parvularculaceae bacterium]|nr:c-type cytochrome biogenesis protein CcmI [Parvularculaceae bacterium]